MLSGLFAPVGQLSHYALPVGRESKRLSHACIIQRPPSNIETIEVRAEIIVGVKIRPLHQQVQQFSGDQVFVPNDVSNSSFIKI